MLADAAGDLIGSDVVEDAVGGLVDGIASDFADEGVSVSGIDIAVSGGSVDWLATGAECCPPNTVTSDGAVGRNWNDPTFSSFANAGASLLEQIAADGFAGTAFAAYRRARMASQK